MFYGKDMLAALSLPDELRLQLHRADAIDPAIDVVITVDQADVLHLGAHLYDQGRPFHLQVLDHRDRITVVQLVTYRIADHARLRVAGRLPLGTAGPFMCALRTHTRGTVLVRER